MEKGWGRGGQEGSREEKNGLTIAQNLSITERIINGLCKAKCLQSDRRFQKMLMTMTVISEVKQ